MDKTEMKLKLKKNKLEMEYKDKLQVRQVLFLALIGIPLTIFNIAITLIRFGILKIDLPLAIIVSLIVSFFLWSFADDKTNELKDFRDQIDSLEKQFLNSKEEKN